MTKCRAHIRRRGRRPVASLAGRDDVVLDLNFWKRKQRDRVCEQIRALGADVCRYRLVCSDDEAWRRIERRNADPSSGLFKNLGPTAVQTC
jgi:predicted kinase